MKAFKPGQAVEFCPVSCRDTALVKWRAGEYVGPDQSRGWHRVKIDAFGTVELFPVRRIREVSPPSVPLGGIAAMCPICGYAAPYHRENCIWRARKATP